MKPTVGLTLRLLGPIQVLVAGEPLPRLRSRKVLWTLALLALRGGRPVSREWLAGTLWPDADREIALSNLRPVVSDLRRVLGAEGRRLQSPERSTVLFDVADADIDVTTFDALIKSGKRADLERAVELYRGPLLEGCPEEWAEQERGAREGDFLQALQTLGDTALAAGDADGAATLFRRAMGIDPWRDSPRRGLMEALAKGGDPNAAFHAYREFADFLRGDSGTAPDEETTALYERLRRAARRPSKGASQAAQEDDRAEGYLPHPLTEIVGREDEGAEVAALLRRARLVTLVGTGGIGKTRLALMVASQTALDYPDGAWFVSLESLSHPRQIERQIASVLGFLPEDGKPTLEVVTERLRRRRLLLVLDNCEHLLEGAAQVAAHLLRECRDVRILATSREALRVIGETAWAVPTLATPTLDGLPQGAATLQRVLMAYEGVRLFVERARAANKDFALNAENAPLVAQVCVRLEGIPLAIELTAARARSMTPEHILSCLQGYSALLNERAGANVERQHTLRSTLDWSYELLDEKERALLRRLSVFVGGWTREAAEAVAGGGAFDASETPTLMTSLVDKSLVLFDEGRGRYRLLEMVRQYALEKLEESGETGQARAGHQAWCAALVEEAEQNLKGSGQAAWLQRLAEDYDNLRTALEHEAPTRPESDLDMRMAGVMWRFWFVRADYDEGSTHLVRILNQSRETTIHRVKALQGVGAIWAQIGEIAPARAVYQEALQASWTLSYPVGVAGALHGLACVERLAGNDDSAQRLAEESIGMFFEIGDENGAALALANLALGVYYQGEYDRARPLFEESARLFERLGDAYMTAEVSAFIASIDEMRGSYEEARIAYERCLDVSSGLGDKRGVATSLGRLGEIDHKLGNFDDALSFYERCIGALRDLGDLPRLVWRLVNLSDLYLARGDLSSAKTTFEESRRLAEGVSRPRVKAWALRHSAYLALAEGDLLIAAQDLRGALELIKDGKHKPDVVLVLETTARLMLSQNQGAESARLLGAAHALRRAMDMVVPPFQWDAHGALNAKVSDSLGEFAYDVAWREGMAMDWSEAANYALLLAGGVRPSYQFDLL